MALQPSSKAQFLQLWRQLLPEVYTGPIEASVYGLDIPASHAAMWEQVETAYNVSQQAYYLRSHSTQTGPIASSGVKSSGEVEFRRAAPAIGDITIPVGTALIAEIADSFGEPLFLGRYFTTEAVTLAEGSLGPTTVPVEAEYPGYTGDVLAGSIVRIEEQGRLEVSAFVDTATRLARAVPASDQTDRFETGLVGRYVRLVGGSLASDNARTPRLVVATYAAVDGQLGIEVDLALDAGDLGEATTVEVEEYEDLGVTVSQPDPITGGAADALGAIGVDRGIGKTPGETDAAFRARLQAMPDIVSPAAIVRILDRILGSAGIPYELLETRAIDELMGFTWDVHPYDVGQVCPPIDKLPGSEYVGQGAVFLGPGTLTRFFVVCIGQGFEGEFGSFYDADTFFPGAPNAWDVMFLDGFPLGYAALAGQVYEEINRARAAGVGFMLIRDGAF